MGRVERENIPEGDGRGSEVGHVPVLLPEAIDFLAVKRGGSYLDATVGLGGHSCEIAKRLGAQGRLIGCDKDPQALQVAQARLTGADSGDWPEIRLEQGSFAQVGKWAEKASLDGMLADLGMSSLQLGNAERGFSFQAEGPLDMRMDPYEERTAEQVVNRLDEPTLADVIYEYGEERRSRRIARAIVRSRPIRSTAHLAEIISAAARPMNQAERRIHPATRTFQGIRIFVNRELDDLRELLQVAPRLLKPGGRLVIISFHSLEDRIVKDAFREGLTKGYYRVLTKKPVTAGEAEIAVNPRSRSAKMRAAEKVLKG